MEIGAVLWRCLFLRVLAALPGCSAAVLGCSAGLLGCSFVFAWVVVFVRVWLGVCLLGFLGPGVSGCVVCSCFGVSREGLLLGVS